MSTESPANGIDELAILKSIEEFQAELEASTIPHAPGRKIATIGSARALSLAFKHLNGRIGADLRVMMEHGMVRTDSNPPELGVEVFRGQIDKHDDDAVGRAALCDALVEVLSWPVDRHNEQGDVPPRDRQRFYCGDVIEDELVQQLKSACARLRLRLARAGTRPSESGPTPAATRRHESVEQRSGPKPEALDPTDECILRLLRKDPQVRLTTGQIADRLNRSAKSIGKNLAKLARLELIDNVRRKGYSALSSSR